MFKLKDIKTYTTSQLYLFRAKALASQGIGHNYSNMLENRIIKIGKELKKRGENI